MTCSLCGSTLAHHLLKSDHQGNEYRIGKCLHCTVWQIFPLPTSETLNALYQDTYFQKRTDRGYDNYNSPAIQKSVVATLEKNLSDLDFYAWEKSLGNQKSALEIGCAAGHVSEYFHNRHWNIQGIDIAREMIEVGKKSGRPIEYVDFLKHDFSTEHFDLIMLWATLEHLVQPQRFIEKMAALLKPDGRIYLSTCNTGYFARRNGVRWRYLNVPEHVFYFNQKSLQNLVEHYELKITQSFTYGSGYTTRADATIFYRTAKKIADKLAHYFFSGDMIVVEIQKIK